MHGSSNATIVTKMADTVGDIQDIRVSQFSPLKRSIDNWGQTPPVLRVADDDGAARGMGVYKLWNHHVRNLLLTCQTVDFYKKPCPFFGVDRQLGIRVKHVDDNYQSQMNDTQQARELAAQLPLNGFSGLFLTQLECGYYLDLFGTLVEKAAFICRKDRKILWLWQIWGGGQIRILAVCCPAGVSHRSPRRCMPTMTSPGRTERGDFMRERDTLNPEALGLGRKSRGLTQAKLVALIGVSAARWSRIESGIIALRVEDSCVSRICEVLDYPVRFFHRDVRFRSPAKDGVFHRKRASVRQAKLDEVYALAEIRRHEIAQLLEADPRPVAVPEYPVELFEDNPANNRPLRPGGLEPSDRPGIQYDRGS